MPRIALLGLCGVTCLIIATSVGIPQEKTSPKKAKAQRHDAEGFALPEGAVARLGTLRGVRRRADRVLGPFRGRQESRYFAA